ncbi:alpha/beta hydrolase [Chondromyces apiculatus]|uniref:AB hydrolase-1 domain-containing protein n=1 Tax=Chondromyces apiculatus DSM 436 TaxID=1192034 RepID=A0A017SY53_9BACT|nr:alpha/beta fold hydrolase [Chondromyces apiculatus]EYF01914.1 Hypothetical protein CAP_7682 [Chondromyces apiculatus DSM 436]
MHRPLSLAASLLALAPLVSLAACEDDGSSSTSTPDTTSPTSSVGGSGGAGGGAGGSGAEGGAGGSGGEGGQSAPIVWGPCPESYVDAECATVPMPLDHDHPEGATIDIFVARRLSGQPDAPQLWMLEGGPGSSGEAFFYGAVDRFAALMPGVDLYVPDHRGTGRSGHLACDGEDPASPGGNLIVAEEWPACAAQVATERAADLPFLDVTSAARDLGALIARASAPDQPVLLYGLSYGSYLALRYLHLFPERLNAVVLEGVVSPGELFVSQLDQVNDLPAQAYAALCAADPTCSSKLGPDPWARLGAIAAMLDAGHCAAAGIDRRMLREIMAGLFMGWRTRLVSLALPYRLERCAAEDLVAIEHFKTLWFEPYDLTGFSQALEVHIDVSELWEDPAPSAAELEARADAAIYSPNWAETRRDVYPLWPKYPADGYTLTWPETDVPMLMLNGTLDSQTHLTQAEIAASHFNGPHQTFVAVPNAPHVVSAQSPTTLGDNVPCGTRIIANFLLAPASPVDTSCIAALRPLEFEDATRAAVYFGTGSVWENVPLSASAAPTAASTAAPTAPPLRRAWHDDAQR